MPRRALFVASIALASITSPGTLRAQCDHAGWQEGWNAPGIALSSEIYPDGVRAMTVWDPDGDGPEESLLVLGGSFIAAGHVSVKNIVAWNGRTFVTLGSGLGGPVFALETTEDGTLVAGGAFGTRGDGATGYNRAAYFNGTDWAKIGSGVNGTIHKLIRQRDEPAKLYAVGEFTVIGNGVSCPSIAVCSPLSSLGFDWTPVVISGENGFPRPLYSIAYRGSQPLRGRQIVLGCDKTATSSNTLLGYFPQDDQVENWQWLPTPGTKVDVLSPLFLGAPLDLQGRRLWKADSATDAITPVAGVDGAVGAILQRDTNPGSFDYEYAIGGWFDTVAGITCNGIIRYTVDGNWEPMGGGVDGGVLAIAHYKGEYYAAGRFTNSATGRVRSIARWDGARWRPLGDGFFGFPSQPVADITALATFEDDVYASGTFHGAGDSYARGIARHTGGQWSGVAGGLGPSSGEYAHALVVHGRKLIAAGVIYDGADTSAYRVRAWDGTAWSYLGGRFNSWANALVVHNNELYVFGHFTQIDGLDRPRVAKWDGSSWVAVGGFNNEVLAAASYNGELYAGGRFTFSVSGGLARWNGLAWERVLGFVGASSVRSLISHKGKLAVGGLFLVPTVGTQNITTPITLYDGTAFSIPAFPPDGAGGWPYVETMAEYNGDLIVGGGFTTVGGFPASSIARWDGSVWSNLDGGIGSTGSISSLHVRRGSLFVGGTFSIAGGIPSSALAEWRDGPLWIDAWPDQTTAGAGQTVEIATDVEGSGSYTWMKDGQPLGSGGTTAWGSTIYPDFGNLTITDAQPQDSGEYTVTLKLVCGTEIFTATDTVSVVINQVYCPSDFNTDGFSDAIDLDLFIISWLAADPSSDINHDGFQDAIDYDLFMQAFFLGC